MKVEKLPPLEIIPGKPNDGWLYYILWRETHLRTKEPIWKTLVVYFMYFAGFLVLLSINYFAFHVAGFNPSQLWLVGPPFLVLLVLLYIAEPAVHDWLGSLGPQVAGYRGWYGTQASGWAILTCYEGEGPKLLCFRNKTVMKGNHYGPESRRVNVDIDYVQGFLLMNETEYFGANHFGAEQPIHNLIVVDLGPHGLYEICRHFGSKVEVAELHAKLVQAFMTNRPKTIIDKPTDADDPI